MSEPKFPLGQIVATPNVLGRVSQGDIRLGLSRHANGDWGEVCPGDRAANNRALREDQRLLSVYCSADGVKFWIITEWDRSVTTILMPEDY